VAHKNRSSYQTGSIVTRYRDDGTEYYLLRYRVRDPSAKSGWKEKTEVLASTAKKKALEEGQKRMREINKINQSSPRPSLTFESFANGLWRSFVANKNYKPSTVSSYQSMLDNYVLPLLGKKLLNQIGPEQVTSFLEDVRAGGVSSKYLLNLYTLVRLMFEVAVEYDLIEVNPVRKKLHRPSWERKEKPALSAEEIRRVIERVPERYRMLFVLVALTGLRVGELLALRWRNVFTDSRLLTITHSLWKGQLVSPKTKSSMRSIRLPAMLVRLLQDHRAVSKWIGPDDFVFCREDGSPLNPDYLRKDVLYVAIASAGIERVSREHGFHLFRHSAASIVHAETRDLKAAQELLGHSRIDTTADVYVHTSEAVAEEATETLARAIIPESVVFIVEPYHNKVN
jgi:integrase